MKNVLFTVFLSPGDNDGRTKDRLRWSVFLNLQRLTKIGLEQFLDNFVYITIIKFVYYRKATINKLMQKIKYDTTSR